MSGEARSVAEIEELLGAYALDAVDADERRLVEDHLSTCPRCRDELAGHLEVASWMAGGGSRAPEGVWDRIVDALDDTAPAMRLSAADLDVARRAGATSPTPRLTPVAPGPRLETVAEAAAGGDAEVVSLADRSRRTLTRTLVAAVSVAAAVILVLGVVVARQEDRLDDMSREVAAVDIQRAAGQAMADPDATKVALSPPDGGDATATVVVLPDGTGFLLGSLPDLPGDRTYQLWGIDGERVISLGVLGSEPTVAAFPVGEAGFTTYALTEEVRGGVGQSQNPPMAVGAV